MSICRLDDIDRINCFAFDQFQIYSGIPIFRTSRGNQCKLVREIGSLRNRRWYQITLNLIISTCSNFNKNTSFLMQILTFIYKQNLLKKTKTEHNRTHVVQSLYIACNNLLPLCQCNRESLGSDLKNVPGTFAQIIEVPNLFKSVNVIDIRTKWSGYFRRLERSRGNLSHESQNWLELS